MQQLKKEGNASCPVNSDQILNLQEWSQDVSLNPSHFWWEIPLLNIPFGHTVPKWFNRDPTGRWKLMPFVQTQVMSNLKLWPQRARQQAWRDRHDRSIPQLSKTQLFAVCSDNLSTQDHLSIWTVRASAFGEFMHSPLQPLWGAEAPRAALVCQTLPPPSLVKAVNKLSTQGCTQWNDGVVTWNGESFGTVGNPVVMLLLYLGIICLTFFSQRICSVFLPSWIFECFLASPTHCLVTSSPGPICSNSIFPDTLS